MALGSVSYSRHLASKCSSIPGRQYYSAVTASQNHSNINVLCAVGLANQGRTAAADAAACGERGLKMAGQGFSPPPYAAPPSLQASGEYTMKALTSQLTSHWRDSTTDKMVSVVAVFLIDPRLELNRSYMKLC